MDAAGWERAALTARRHRSTRLHALTMAPAAISRGRLRAAGTLVRFAVGPAGSPVRR
jgi:hypothetical protein